MRHAIRYEGGYERNFSTLRPGAKDFEGDDGARHTLPPWPKDTDGLRFGFMERQGKKFVAVRVQYGSTDVILPHDIAVERELHLDGKRLGPEPLVLSDSAASQLLGDAITANPDQRNALIGVRDAIRKSMATPEAGAK
jgi:hypothetical protein